MRQAIINDVGTVINIIVGDGGGIEIPEDSPVTMGWKFVVGQFVAPPEPPPSPYPPMPSVQEQLDALFAGGKTASDMKTKIDAIKAKFRP